MPGVSLYKATCKHFEDPFNVFLAASCVGGLTVLGGRLVSLIGGKNLGRYAWIGSAGAVYGTLSGFSDLTDVPKSAIKGYRDLKSVIWSYYILGEEAESIRISSNEDFPTANLDSVGAFRWGVERVVIAAAKIFSYYVLAHICLQGIGAVKRAPGLILQSVGLICAIFTNSMSTFIDQPRKLIDGPVEGKVDPKDLRRYKELYQKSCKIEKFNNMTFMAIKILALTGVLCSLAGKSNLVKPWIGDVSILGYTIFGIADYVKTCQSGAEMNALEFEHNNGG